MNDGPSRTADCGHVRSLLAGLAAAEPDQELGAAAHAELRLHLRECHSCRAEAGGFLRAGRALRAAVVARDASIADEELQAHLHAQIMARVAKIDWQDQAGHPAGAAALGPGVLGFARWRRELAWPHVAAFAAAAMLLAAIGFWAFGFWLDDGGARQSIWDRRPMHAHGGGPVRAVPYAGPRVELMPVGLPIDDFGSAENGVGPGMMGRGRLRTQIDEEFALPVVVPSPR